MNDRDFERDIERLRAADLEFVCRPFVDAQASMIGIDELSPAWADGVRVQGNRLNKFESRPRRYGHSLTEEIAQLQRYTFNKFNTEGEKQMEKIDWSKPLWAFKTPGHEVVDAKVYTYKSGRQRVVWVDERVYPVDDQGRAVADVDYGLNWVKKGHQIVENVPEGKFFVGLYRLGNGRYEITDCGQTTTMGVLNSWKRLMADQPHWIVDTRKSAARPDPVKHDPTDYVVIYYGDEDETATCTNRLLTQKKAKALCGSTDTIVRVRTTPAPVGTSRYTSRYIQLWRLKESEPWKINALDGRQEFTWGEVGFRVNPASRNGYQYCNVKVRD